MDRLLISGCVSLILILAFIGFTFVHEAPNRVNAPSQTFFDLQPKALPSAFLPLKKISTQSHKECQRHAKPALQEV
jgi:hypothetical protein